MKNKLFKTIMISLLTIFLVASCSNNSNDREPLENEIKDGAGNIITIPDNPSQATVASVYAVSTPFFIALQMTDRVVAINTKKPFMKNVDEGLQKAGNIGNGTVDLEKLMNFSPTALVHRSNDPKTVKAVNKLGIDVIQITVEDMEDTKETLLTLGKYFGKEERAYEVCSWLDTKYEYIDSIVNNIPLDSRKTAMVMGGELGRVSGSDMLQCWMIEKAGGISVVKEGQNHNWINIGVEKVFNYNPEYIFCTSSTARSYDIEKIKQDSAWKSMLAIQNNNINIIPAINDSWDMPGISPILGVLYMLRIMYPEYLSLEELQNQIDDYYEYMFGKTFTEDELKYAIK